ncbi:MAG: RNA-binding protein [Alphaproteobacteria bacterium]|nr:MAG: RNA-binding protein [Alphaproteobacteria bacterium]
MPVPRADDGQGDAMRERRCVIKMQAEPEEKLVRLVQGPDGSLVPDVAARLPGRGIWISADAVLIDAAVASGQLAKAASRSLKASVPKSAVPADLAAQIDRLLARRCLDRLGLEQRAGHVVTGFDKIKAALSKRGAGRPRVLLAATDGADDGRRKLKAAVGSDVPVAAVFDREALSLALGRENVVHVLLFDSGGAVKFEADLGRLMRMRGLDPHTCEAQGNEG